MLDLDVDKIKVALLQNKLIHEFNIKTYAPITNMSTEVIYDVFKINFQKYDLDFFKFSDGMYFSWKYYKSTLLNFGGICNINSLLDIIASPIDVYCPEELLGSKKLVKFDTFDEASILSKYVLLNISTDNSLSLWYWDEDGDKYPLNLTISEYVKQAIVYRGAFNWQYFWIDTDRITSNECSWACGTTVKNTIAEIKIVLNLMRDIFPDESFKNIEERSKSIETSLLNIFNI